MTNIQKIANALIDGEKLTRSIAVNKYEVNNLSNVVSVLRKKGYKIHTRSVGRVNPLGDFVTISEYWINDKKKEPREWIKSERK